MNNLKILNAFVILALLISVFSCKKSDDDPVPEEKKKFAWAVGSVDSTGYGSILFSPDGGLTWERQGLGLNSLQGIAVNDVWPVDEETVWAVGDQNKIFKTINSGQDWTAINPGGRPESDLKSICIHNNETIWISSSIGKIYKSDNMGTSWQIVEDDVLEDKYLQGIWAYDNGVVYTVGGEKISGRDMKGFIAYSNDEGDAWDSITPANNYNQWEWIGVKSFGEKIVIYGEHAHYIASYDGGETWINDSVSNSQGMELRSDLNDLVMLDEDTWWAAFDLGLIYITEDAGATWTKQQEPSHASGSFLVGIDYYDKDLALIVGFASFYPPVSPIIRTENGGAVWDSVYTHDVPLWKVSFVKD